MLNQAARVAAFFMGVSMWERFWIDWVLWVDCQWVEHGLPAKNALNKALVPVAEQLPTSAMTKEAAATNAGKLSNQRRIRQRTRNPHHFRQFGIGEMYKPAGGGHHCRLSSFPPRPQNVKGDTIGPSSWLAITVASTQT